MSDPKSMFQMIGADLTPSKLSDATLVLIDCQREYVDGKLPLDGVNPAMDEAGRLLVRARNAGTPVIHIQHKGKPGGAFDPDGPGWAIDDRVAPLDGEPVLPKGMPNSFFGTDLADELEKTGRKELIIVGFMTHVCVSTTARSAMHKGFRTTVVADAAATRALPGATGGVVDAATVHNVALTELADRFAIVAKSADDIGD